MKLNKFKKKQVKKQIIVYSIIGIALLGGIVTLYKTFALYEEKLNFNIIQGRVPETTSGDVKIASLINGEKTTIIPEKDKGYIFDSISCNNEATALWDNEKWAITILNLSKSNTTCTISFKRLFSDYLINLSKSNDEIVAINHKETIQANSLTDYRYIGSNPNNYVCFGN